MGKIASDFYQSFGETDTLEASFEAEELLRMASVDVQEEYAGWMESDEDLAGYIPGEVLTALLRDRAFFAGMMAMRDAGEYVILSGVTMGFTSDHIGRMGLREEDTAENVAAFLENEENMTLCIRSALSGGHGRVSAIYVFANGWFGVETQTLADLSWMDHAGTGSDPETAQAPGAFGNQGPQEEVYEPSASYLFSDEGDLVATPDLHDDLNAWMEFVDMFSAVHEEASAAEDTKGAQAGAEEDTFNSFIVYSPEVEEAIQEARPVVVIESAATFGGMIYPGISDFAFHMRNTIRENGATPAFAAIIGGKIHVGLTDDEIRYLETKRGSIHRASARDIPILLAKHADGCMTLSAAVQVASMVGLYVACGSGIGGAQIGAERTMDISGDLEAVASNAVMLICSGTKPFIDLSLTMEYLETKGVSVIGYSTDRMPEYMTRGSGFRLTYRMDTPEELAQVMKIKAKMGIPGGILVVNPVPKEYELDPVRTRRAVDDAIQDAKKNKVQGKSINGYLMGRIREYLGDDSVESQKAFLINNAVLAARVAAALRRK